MSAAPTPTSETPRAIPISIGARAPSRRLAQTIREHDVKGESAIALGQAASRCLCWRCTRSVPHDVPSLQRLGPLALSALIVSSAVRWWLTTDDRLPERGSMP